MNRRGFFGLLGKLIAVGTAMGVSPELLAPLKEIVPSASFTVTKVEVWYDDEPTYTLAS